MYEGRCIQIQTTFPNREEAKELIDGMLKVSLIACGQMGDISSIYDFEGKRCEDNEILVTLKTREALYDECETFIKKHHSYKVPQVIALKITDGEKDYMKWIETSTKNY